MAADRGAYICQSQSMNIHMQDANFGKLTSMHFHAWKLGLKTGLYYLRTKAAADAAVNAVIDCITKAVKKEPVQVIGFGTFSVVKRAARKGINPQTGEKIKIKASKSVKFKPGAKLKAAI